MISLRARLALLLVAAIFAVVVIAAFVTFQITDRRRDGSFERSFADAAQAVSTLLDGSAARAQGAGLFVGPRPAEGDVVEDVSRRINRELSKRDAGVSILVTRKPDGQRRMAIQLRNERWVYLTYPSEPPSPLRGLTSYLTFVALGAAFVALFAARRITGPMRLLEEAAESVRPDGTLPFIPEKGPGEVRAAAKAINALSSRLKTAMESRMRLVAAAGHDLRTPMTRMRLRAEFMPDAEREIWLRDLSELDTIADSAIRLVREEVEEFSFEPVDLRSLAEEIVDELQQIGLQAEVTTLADLTIDGQPLALKRALRNLVENAARHGGGARLALEKAGDFALIRIDDDGPGIPEDLLGRVFEPFFRVDPGRRKIVPGAGLGLAIAREIIERHKGTIIFRNRPEGGLTQEIRLPNPWLA